MFKNYLRIAWRNLKKNKAFTIINIIGLSVGIAASLLIIVYVTFENSYDSFLGNTENTYRVRYDRYKEGEQLFESAKSCSAIGPALLAEFPEVKAFARGCFEHCLMKYGDIKFNDEKVFWVDSAFLEIVQLELEEGDPKTALKKPNTAVISQKIAKKYFGDKSPMGETVILNEGIPFMITGIYKNIPQNSHLELDFLLSYSTFYSMGFNWGRYEGNWGYNWVYTYIQLEAGASPQNVESKIAALMDKYQPRLKEEQVEMKFFLQPVERIHLESQLDSEMKPGGNDKILSILAMIAVLILLLAWINFINLSTAQSLERAKETGIMKAVGARRIQLVTQFLFESLLINTLGVILALTAVQFLLPFFSMLTGRELTGLGMLNSTTWVLFSLVILLGILFSSLYPAFVLSSFQPVKVLKGKVGTQTKGIGIRKALVLVQFAASVILIAGALTIYMQVEYMQNRHLGFDMDQQLVLKAPRSMNQNPQKGDRFRIYRDLIMKEKGVVAATSSLNVPGEEVFLHTEGLQKYGSEDGRKISFSIYQIDPGFIKTYNLELLAGKNFIDLDSNSYNSVLLNETAAKMLEFDDYGLAIGQILTDNNRKLKVRGILKDFHQKGLQSSIAPMVFYYAHPVEFGFYTVRIKTEDIKKTVAALQTIWEGQYPSDPFDFFFLDEFFNTQYHDDIRFGNVFTLFTFLAIFIAILGILGLTSYSAIQRTKEVGIRKSLGAESLNIFVLFTKGNLQLIVISLVIALPAAHYFFKNWLNNYRYRIELGWWFYILPFVLLSIITLAATTYHITKVARTNPIKSLRYE